MTTRQLKLGLVPTGVGGPGDSNRWLDTDIPLDASVSIDWYIDVVRQAEAAKVDPVFIVDSQFITPNSPPHYLNRLEPLTLLSALAVATKHIGLVGTLTTSYNDPFNLARRFASLDLISKGRAGWNVVTSGDAGTAGNFSQPEHFDYDTRYRRAVEFLDVARGLWSSWEEGALVRDRATGQFLDADRLHRLDHQGEFFQVVGPLNLQRSPQGEPVIFQAGDSDQGRDLGATIADAIFTHAATIEQGQAFYADLKGRAIRQGRNPDEIVILPGFSVYVGDTDADAQDIQRRYRELDQSFDQALADIRECDDYARGLSSPYGYQDTPYPYAGTLAGAAGGAIGNLMVSMIFGSAEIRKARRTNMRRCMNYKGYDRYGLNKDVWQEFHFEEGLKSVKEEDRQRMLAQQAKAASLITPVGKVLGR